MRMRDHARARRRRRRIGTALGALALLLAIGRLWLARHDGPWGPIPGGRLVGPERPCPARADPFAAVREVELEVAPEAPRSVRIWSVVVDDRLFVPGDFLTPRKRWPAQVVADPRVRIRIEDQIYRCLARRVTDPATIEALRRATARKYRVAPDGWAARSEVWWFELGPRRGDARPRAANAEGERSQEARSPDAGRADAG